MKRFKRATVLPAAARLAVCSGGHTPGPEIQPDPQPMQQPHSRYRDLPHISTQSSTCGTSWTQQSPCHARESQNHGMVCVGRDLKAHLIPTHCHRQHLPLDQVEIWARAYTHPLGCTVMPTVLVPSISIKTKNPNY